MDAARIEWYKGLRAVLVLRKRKLELLMAVLIILVAILFSEAGVRIVDGRRIVEKKATIAIDAGHGGVDSGKVSVLGDYEKDLNLSIAARLEKRLKKKGYQVVMTRTDDQGPGAGSGSGWKTRDLRERSRIIDSSGAVMGISIHQNSYHDSSVRGAQVFYYKDSSEGERLAGCVQRQLRESLDKDNDRMAKGNGDYYLLRNTSVPTVIVECAFLSNYDEAGRITDEEYQNKVAGAIVKGIEEYLKGP